MTGLQLIDEVWMKIFNSFNLLKPNFESSGFQMLPLFWSNVTSRINALRRLNAEIYFS